MQEEYRSARSACGQQMIAIASSVINPLINCPTKSTPHGGDLRTSTRAARRDDSPGRGPLEANAHHPIVLVRPLDEGPVGRQGPADDLAHRAAFAPGPASRPRLNEPVRSKARCRRDGRCRRRSRRRAGRGRRRVDRLLRQQQVSVHRSCGDHRQRHRVVRAAPHVDLPAAQDRLAESVHHRARRSASFYDVSCGCPMRLRAPHYPMPLPVVATTIYEREPAAGAERAINTSSTSPGTADATFVGAVGHLGDTGPCCRTGFRQRDRDAGPASSRARWARSSAGPSRRRRRGSFIEGL